MPTPNSWMPRNVGLSRNAGQGAPLSIVGGVPLRPMEDIYEPEDPSALPESSGDESPGPSRGDIQPTKFKAEDRPSNGRTSRTSTRGLGATSNGGYGPNKLKRAKHDDIEDDQMDERGSKKPRVSQRIGDHHHTDPFARQKYKAPVNKTYGRSSQTSVIEDESSSSPSPESTKRTKRALEVPELAASPRRKSKKMVIPDVSATPPKPRKTLILPPKIDSPAKPQRTLAVPADDEMPDAPSQEDSSRPVKRIGKVRPPLKKAKKPKAPSPRPARKLDIPSFDFDDNSFDADLDEVKDLQSFAVKPTVGRSPSPDRGPVCPMCEEPVEQDFLDKFSKKRYMSFAQQQKFCTTHKTRTARETWTNKGYPDINWARLNNRIAKHYSFLEDILEGGFSHYGTLYARQLKGGGIRTLRKMDMIMTPGYYGPRGLRIMTESVIEHFSGLLRRIAARDRVVSARGQTTFVQCVLVPELGVRLIMDDMDVDEEEARKIMEESMIVGELLNEEEGDVVLEEDSDDGSSSSLTSLPDDDEELAI